MSMPIINCPDCGKRYTVIINRAPNPPKGEEYLAWCKPCNRDWYLEEHPLITQGG